MREKNIEASETWDGTKPPDNATPPEQKVLYRPTVDLTSRQVPRPSADAPEFQKSQRHDYPMYGRAGGASPDNIMTPQRGTPAGAFGDTRPTAIVGNLVTGPTVDSYPTEADCPSMLGGRDILVAGCDFEGTPFAPPANDKLDDLDNPRMGQLPLHSR